MSDCITKIIPRDPLFIATETSLSNAKAIILQSIKCDSVVIEHNETPSFIDCGSNLESIRCPECGEALDFGWWGEAMDGAFEWGFLTLEVETPCCAKKTSLNELRYDFPCGFACCAVNVLNPVSPIDEKTLDSVRNILGTDVRVIQAHT